jgi:hypothetical protein
MSVNAAKRVNTKISLSPLNLKKTFIIKMICTRDLSLHLFCVQALLNIFDFEEIVFCLMTDSEVVDVSDRHCIVRACVLCRYSLLGVTVMVCRHFRRLSYYNACPHKL